MDLLAEAADDDFENLDDNDEEYNSGYECDGVE